MSTACKCLFASSATQDGIETSIAKFYAGEKKVLRPTTRPPVVEWLVVKTDGTPLSNVRVVKKAGRYRFEQI